MWCFHQIEMLIVDRVNNGRRNIASGATDKMIRPSQASRESEIPNRCQRRPCTFHLREFFWRKPLTTIHLNTLGRNPVTIELLCHSHAQDGEPRGSAGNTLPRYPRAAW